MRLWGVMPIWPFALIVAALVLALAWIVRRILKKPESQEDWNDRQW